jgi:hypothetical protein
MIMPSTSQGISPSMDPKKRFEHRKPNAVYEKKLTELSNFKNYKMG